jgi:hypothetical protein
VLLLPVLLQLLEGDLMSLLLDWWQQVLLHYLLLRWLGKVEQTEHE